MTKKKLASYLFGGGLLVFVLIQLIPVDFSNPPVNANEDILQVTQASDEVAQIMRTSCYDCHSHETQYPWYSKVAPASWFLKSHIDEGRRELNFSTWATYEPKRQHKKLDEMVEAITEGWMPMESYTWMHQEAILSTQEKELLTAWVKTLSDPTP